MSPLRILPLLLASLFAVQADAADALGAAITHAHHAAHRSVLQHAQER